MLYLLDANVLITANRDYYPLERVPEFWTWLVDCGVAERVKIPVEMYEEVLAGDTKDELTRWLKDNRDVLVLDEDVDEKLVARVTEEGYGSNLTDEEVERMGRDPFLIAYAVRDGASRVVVTTEVSRPSAERANRKIPDVCRKFDIHPCTTFDLIAELDFKTGWQR